MKTSYGSDVTLDEKCADEKYTFRRIHVQDIIVTDDTILDKYKGKIKLNKLGNGLTVVNFTTSDEGLYMWHCDFDGKNYCILITIYNKETLQTSNWFSMLGVNIIIAMCGLIIFLIFALAIMVNKMKRDGHERKEDGSTCEKTAEANQQNVGDYLTSHVVSDDFYSHLLIKIPE
ncbi:hypothetical protein HELRODRAFT_159250 [Helobdella robusta]|uniref:Immunoglobulin V-set domain-containing protein n=1 Tax=Helobdella robusta TaxID=6412 RepID=T1ENT0_HELRO|nr:hypothetical protein HELRODRAFT_159250 [Helobdella robusta]ESO12672.1 hypothetical protein HELRODRAFT_159250 [Helobdella robusta]